MSRTLTVFLFLGFFVGSLSAQENQQGAAELGKRIRRAVDESKEEEALALIDQLGATSGLEAAKTLFELGLTIQVPKLYKKITELLAQRIDDESLKYYEEEAKSGKDLRQTYLTDVLAAMTNPRAAEILGLLAEEKSALILRSAIPALGRLKMRGSVLPLLTILARLDAAKDKSQVYQEARDALFELTGQDYDEIADWTKWWQTRAETFEPGKKSEGATQARKMLRDAVPEFGGKKILGKNVVFVIDTSGTMRFILQDDIPGLYRTTGRGTDTSGGETGPKEKGTKADPILAKFWTRMEMAKRELLKALGGFDVRVRINVIEFNTKVRRLEKALFEATPANKKKAIDWVRKMTWKQDGFTDTLAAIEEAFATDRATTEIYFLSDGIPSKDGQNDDPTDPILERVEALNRFRKVKIHTFGYDPLIISEGVDHPDLLRANEFLRALAKCTGGVFTLLKVTDEKPPKDFKVQRSQSRSGGSGA